MQQPTDSPPNFPALIEALTAHAAMLYLWGANRETITFRALGQSIGRESETSRDSPPILPDVVIARNALPAMALTFIAASRPEAELLLNLTGCFPAPAPPQPHTHTASAPAHGL
jgi:hypothetical protein